LELIGQVLDGISLGAVDPRCAEFQVHSSPHPAGPDAAADPVAGFQDRDAVTLSSQRPRGAESGESGADDENARAGFSRVKRDCGAA
jgi:hypothetical protein